LGTRRLFLWKAEEACTLPNCELPAQFVERILNRITTAAAGAGSTPAG